MVQNVTSCQIHVSDNTVRRVYIYSVHSFAVDGTQATGAILKMVAQSALTLS